MPANGRIATRGTVSVRPTSVSRPLQLPAGKQPFNFDEPQSPWRRSTNDHKNCLTQQHLPKGCDLGAYPEADIQAIEVKINQRTRKRFDFQTAQQALDIFFNRGALCS